MASLERGPRICEYIAPGKNKRDGFKIMVDLAIIFSLYSPDVGELPRFQRTIRAQDRWQIGGSGAGVASLSPRSLVLCI